MKKSLAFIFMINLFLLPGCKKYPDGPLISFKSAQDRIKGKWYYDHFYEDGKDLVGLITCDTCYGHSINFTFDSDGDYIFGTGQYQIGEIFGHWNLLENTKCIEFNSIFSSYPPIGPLFNKNFEMEKWRIRRLTTKEFWLTCDFNSKHYELNLYK